MKPNTPIKALLVMALVLPTWSAMADHKESHRHKDAQASIFYSYESNGDDFISGIGADLIFVNSESKLGFGLTTALNYAEVRTEHGFIEDYNAWEGGFKFGYFSNVQIYGEVGIDLTELLFHDFRWDDDYYHDHHHDDYYSHSHHSRDDHIDAYVGVGAGFKLGPLKIDAFSRLREIDSRYWEADEEHFTGVKFSINF